MLMGTIVGGFIFSKLQQVPTKSYHEIALQVELNLSHPLEQFQCQWLSPCQNNNNNHDKSQNNCVMRSIFSANNDNLQVYFCTLMGTIEMTIALR